MEVSLRHSHEGIKRVAVITGAANGIGKAMALGLLGRGFAVVAVDRDRGGLEALRSPLREAHGTNLAPCRQISLTSTQPRSRHKSSSRSDMSTS